MPDNPQMMVIRIRDSLCVLTIGALRSWNWELAL